MYNEWLDSIINQIEKYKNDQQTDLILLKNHLEMLIKDIENTPADN